MRQLVQDLRSGSLDVVDVPDPVAGANEVVVRTQASLISAGTEQALVRAAAKSWIGKARGSHRSDRTVFDICQFRRREPSGHRIPGIPTVGELAMDENPAAVLVFDQRRGGADRYSCGVHRGRKRQLSGHRTHLPTPPIKTLFLA